MTEMTQSPSAHGKGIRIPAEAGIAFVLLMVMIAGSLASPNFLTLSNLFVLLLNGAVIGFLALSGLLFATLRSTGRASADEPGLRRAAFSIFAAGPRRSNWRRFSGRQTCWSRRIREPCTLRARWAHPSSACTRSPLPDSPAPMAGPNIALTVIPMRSGNIWARRRIKCRGTHACIIPGRCP